MDAAQIQSSTGVLARKSVLVSLEMAALGVSGIPNECRIMTSLLARSGLHSVTGLMMEPSDQFTANLVRAGGPQDLTTIEAANYLVGLAGLETPYGFGLMKRWRRFLWRFNRHYGQAQVGYPIKRIQPNLHRDAIWRMLFAKTLSSADRTFLDGLPYLVTGMTRADINIQLALPFAPRPALKTDGFDAAIFHDARPIKLSRGTARVIRYHDAIPITHPDLLNDGTYTTVHHRMLKLAARDSWFVCNSEATQRELLQIVPEAARRAVVIPCAQNFGDFVASEPGSVGPIIRRRSSAYTVRPTATKGDIEVREAAIQAIEEGAGYIIVVAALEPKKNVRGAVLGYERLRALHPNPPKLVIVGAPSWKYERDLAAMEPHLRSGDILHLTHVPNTELAALYAGAQVCFFPSLAEGFGYPPLEALYAGVPSVVSDLAALRETVGPCAVYTDPYDPTAMGDALMAVLHPQTGADVRASLLQHRAQVLRRYERDRIAGLWDSFLSDVRP